MHSHDPADFWFVLTRASHFASCLLLMSVFAFDRFLAAPALRDVPTQFSSWNALRRLIQWTLPISLLTGTWWFALTAIAMSGLPPREALTSDNLAVVWNQTHFGLVWKMRLASWAATAIVALALLKTRQRMRSRALMMWLGLICSTALCISLAWSGHAMSTQAGPWHISADAFHIAVCGIWPTALVPLIAVIWKAPCASRNATESLARLVERFSSWSLPAVALIAFTGVINTLYLLGAPANLYRAPYGRALLVKLVLFLGLLALGAMNRITLRHGIRNDSTAMRSLKLNVVAEIVLAAGVFLAVGYLGLSPPSAHAS